jgi:hypothetical protein
MVVQNLCLYESMKQPLFLQTSVWKQQPEGVGSVKNNYFIFIGHSTHFFCSLKGKYIPMSRFCKK